jgi:hypothetical protein
MIIKRAIAVESLTKVCEESLNLIKQLVDADNEVYAQGFEDGMAAQAEIQKTLRPWFVLTDEEVELYWDWEDFQTGAGRSTIFEMVRNIEAKLKEKNT